MDLLVYMLAISQELEIESFQQKSESVKPQSNYEKNAKLHSQDCRQNPRRDRDFCSRVWVVISSQAIWEQVDQVKQTYPCIYHFLAEKSGDLPLPDL